VNYSTKIQYKLFSDAPEVDMVEVDETDHVMSVGEFLDACISTCFMDYDGFGRFIKEVNDKKYAILDLSFSIDNDDVIYKGESLGSIFYVCNNLSLYEVVWFNK
jgi:hypothetical protein